MFNVSESIERAARLAESIVDPNNIAPQIHDALCAYRDHHQPTGNFLKRVLSNDLFGAMKGADPHSMQTLPAICAWICSELPSDSWGAEDAYKRWVADHLRGRP